MKNLKKGSVISINGEAFVLEQKPKKAIDGSWLVWGTGADNKYGYRYVQETEVTA